MALDRRDLCNMLARENAAALCACSLLSSTAYYGSAIVVCFCETPCFVTAVPYGASQGSPREEIGFARGS
eukprot:scaffold568323_cov19-Prasinocladus_malaysianus.AAC.1